MYRKTNSAETWERAYEAFNTVNFSAWDYDTIKQSMVDYLKLYYPENFNDYIESSDIIMMVEVFAYLGEMMSYRLDMNAHENFISTAQRKESVLRIAKTLSYNPNRNIPARGLVKLTSVSTTEEMYDSRGNNLANRTITWNDVDNDNWKEQFILILNRVMEQEFGSVLPSDRSQVQNILFELYPLDNIPLINGTISYNVSVSGEQYPMELVPSKLSNFGPIERRPEKDGKMTILYLNDGLGDTSDNTGFFIFTKQGVLQRTETTFDGVTPNQAFTLNGTGLNETDVWVNNIDPDTGHILTDSNLRAETRAGEWDGVDIANNENVIYNTNPNRRKYEIETLDNDGIKFHFGDGVFSDIPSGTFEIWTRVSNGTVTTIPTTAIQRVSGNLTYNDENGLTNNFNFTFSLNTPIQNAAPSEDIEHIKRIAPSVYYTQNRMVNGRDYNTYMLQDSSILKLRSINRTFAGDSKYTGGLNDPSGHYDNVKLFGDDGVIFYDDELIKIVIPSTDLPQGDGGANVQLINALINNEIEPLLSNVDFFTKFILSGVAPVDIRATFNSAERLLLESALQVIAVQASDTVYLRFDIESDAWEITQSEPDDVWIKVIAASNDTWEIEYGTKRLVIHSNTTKFWLSNDNKTVITYDTLQSNLDNIVLLKANVGTDGNNIQTNRNFNVVNQVTINEGENAGLPNINELYILPSDSDSDGIPDNIDLDYILDDSHVYFQREDMNSPWVFVETTAQLEERYENNDNNVKRYIGTSGLNFLWLHRTPQHNLVDPSATNIIDTYVIPRGYYLNVNRWLNNRIDVKPVPPKPFELRRDYNELIKNAMVSDTIVLHPGKIKVLFGNKAIPELRAKIKIILSGNVETSVNQLKVNIVNAVNEFFNINEWEFGETFYFSELSAYIHTKLPTELNSVVLVPTAEQNLFGDLYQVKAVEDEIFQPHLTETDIEVVQSLNPKTLKQTL